MSQSLVATRLRPLRGALVIAIAVVAGGCGTIARSHSATATRPVALMPSPSTTDYATIKTAVRVRDDALFHEGDWRRKAFAAALAARTLLTVRVAPGPCAEYVTELYGSLRDLMDAYAGENWRPLVRLISHQPPLESVCLDRRYRLTNGPGAA
jgi:hypothetical protein